MKYFKIHSAENARKTNMTLKMFSPKRGSEVLIDIAWEANPSRYSSMYKVG